MNIVFDANVFFQDWFLDKPDMILLEKFINLGGSKLVIPEVVIIEILNKYGEKFTELIQKINRLKGLLPPSKQLFHSLNKEEILQDYKSALTSRLKILRAERLDFPSISHESVIARNLARKRPFQKNTGYRDTLIWETILSNMTNEKIKTYFISGNHNDFCDKSGEILHNDLQEDLERKGLSPDSVILYHNLAEFVNNQVKPVLTSIEEAKRELIKGVYKGFDIDEWFGKNRESIGSSIQQFMESMTNELRGLEDLSVSYAEDHTEIKIDKVYELDINQIYIDAFAKIEIVFDVFVFKADYYGWVSGKYDLDVIDYDWNDHYIFAQLTTKLPVNFAINFNIDNGTVDNFEVKIEEFFGFCPNCSEPILSDAAEACGECGKSFF